APAFVEVYETGDASLLLTLYQPLGWVRRWEVRDADERPVGAIRGLVLRDGEGRCLAVAQDGEPGSTRFVSPHGLELGSFTRANRGTSLTFASALEGEPFARMVVLGAALALGG